MDRAAEAQRRDGGMEEDCAVQALAAHTPLAGGEAARVPAVADQERRSRRAVAEVAVENAPVAVLDGAARDVEMVVIVVAAAAEAVVLRAAGPEDGLDCCSAAEAARAGVADTRDVGAAAARKAVAAEEVDGPAGADAGAGATRSGAVRGRANGQQEGERKTAVFWSPCPYRHATVRAASYYLFSLRVRSAARGSCGAVKCFDGRGQRQAG